MNVARIIASKRDGDALSSDEIEFLIEGFAADRIPDYQMSAFAMAVFFQGMNLEETIILTRAMRDSGDVLNWTAGSELGDKHSTGGVGDKVSIPLAPALAACGIRVPMISGRGLGPTGGTLDKLESINGFRCDLTTEDFKSTVNRIGCAISGTTETIAPADRKLYALRDVTSTVPAIPLITASILSKKLAEGLNGLVLDVKWGSGAFMKTIEQATALAQTLVKVANELGMKTTALVTDMNQPIGQMVGNACEIRESIDVLRGAGPEDVRELTCLLGGQLLQTLGSVKTTAGGEDEIRNVLDDGSALNQFEQMVEAQHGDLNQICELASASELCLGRSGHIESVDCEKIGLAVIEMGGGRKQMGDQIDFSTGLKIHKRIGDTIRADEPFATIFYEGDNEMARRLIVDAVKLSDEPPGELPLVAKSVG